MSDEQQPNEPEVNFADRLASVIAAFESKFAVVDDHYMHEGTTKTAEGEPFILCCAGATVRENNVTYIALKDHIEAVDEWARVASTIDTAGHDYLAWRVRPHFQRFEDGFILTSSFATGLLSDRNEVTKKRLEPAAPE